MRAPRKHDTRPPCSTLHLVKKQIVSRIEQQQTLLVDKDMRKLHIEKLLRSATTISETKYLLKLELRVLAFVEQDHADEDKFTRTYNYEKAMEHVLDLQRVRDLQRDLRKGMESKLKIRIKKVVANFAEAEIRFTRNDKVLSTLNKLKKSIREKLNPGSLTNTNLNTLSKQLDRLQNWLKHCISHTKDLA